MAEVGSEYSEIGIGTIYLSEKFAEYFVAKSVVEVESRVDGVVVNKFSAGRGPVLIGIWQEQIELVGAECYESVVAIGNRSAYAGEIIEWPAYIVLQFVRMYFEVRL